MPKDFLFEWSPVASIYHHTSRRFPSDKRSNAMVPKMNHRAIQALVVVLTWIAVSSFAPVSRCQLPSSPLQQAIQFRCRSETARLFASKEEEIANLEAQIRQLREDEENGTDKMSVKDFDVAKRRLETMKGKDMLLTEEYLISGGIVGTESKGFNVFGIVGAVVAAVILFAFAQVPVGQENLARYSATGSSVVKSIDLGDLNPDAKR